MTAGFGVPVCRGGFYALRLKIRDEGLVQHKVVYLALGITATGAKDILDFWIAQIEGTAFWQRVMAELQGRGARDILIALIDGLTGFPTAIKAVLPETVIHQCVVHLIRQSLAHVSWTKRKQGRPGCARSIKRRARPPRALRKSLKIRGHSPNDDAASKPLYLTPLNAVVLHGPPRNWRLAMQHITLLFGDRVPMTE
jgi:transposase-like protein